jgi:hypothetical protein
MASRGSVIPLFIDQIKNGQPLTITDPNMTRFLMSLEEAVELVVFAFKNAEADYIIAIGGGSSMDTAKAIGIIIANPEFKDVRSLEGVDGLDFTTARRMLCAILKDELDRHYYLKTSDVLTDEDRILFTKMLHGQDDNIEDSIRMLSKLLYKHYGQKVVILIDEYDVPLDKAFQNGYYKEMVSLIRGLFGQALRTTRSMTT